MVPLTDTRIKAIKPEDKPASWWTGKGCICSFSRLAPSSGGSSTTSPERKSRWRWAPIPTWGSRMPLGIAAVNMSAHNLKALLLHGLLGPPVTGTQFSRDNHYVPRTYLRRWADASGRIWVYRLLVPHARSADWKPASSKGVAFRQHLYTRAVAGGLTDQVEHWLDP